MNNMNKIIKIFKNIHKNNKGEINRDPDIQYIILGFHFKYGAETLNFCYGCDLRLKYVDSTDWYCGVNCYDRQIKLM